jgi:uncharacterized protein YajQ (UPF0234 family)
MPSFDVVSKIDMQEVDNAVNSVMREIGNRYDFKGADFSIELNKKDDIISMTSDSEYRLEAIGDSLKVFVTKRGVDVKALDFQKIEKIGGHMLKQEIKLRSGIEQEIAKKITKQIKESKMKIQASIQGDEIRINGKKRDDLQEAMQFLKDANHEIPLQFINFRD